jgi:hypothetical protein
MKNTTLTILVRYLGSGYKCSHCGRVRESTRYQVRGERGKVLSDFRLCDECQDKGYELKVTVADVEQAFAVISNSERRERLLRKRQVRLSRQLETGVANDISGHVMPGSGNTTHAKADIRKMDQWRLEHKYTDSKSGYRLNVVDLAAVVDHANRFREWPGLIINFRKLARSFVVIPYELFLWVAEILNDDPANDKRFTKRPQAPISKIELT